MKQLKTRIKKLENEKSDKEEMILIIDDIVYYNDKQYSEDEFYKFYPHLKDIEEVEII